MYQHSLQEEECSLWYVREMMDTEAKLKHTC